MAHSLQGLVNSIVSATAGLPDPQTLARWQPQLSGDMDILIERDGRWFHNGEFIHREGLVRLFASLLRREPDGSYYLLTPAEKWRIRVERHALQVIDFEEITPGQGGPVWQALLNTGGRCSIDALHSLHPQGEHGEPYMSLPNGLSAQVSRAAWYRLIDAASLESGAAFIVSDGVQVNLGFVAED